MEDYEREGPPVSKKKKRKRKSTLLKQQTLSRERMPLSKWMRPVIFPPLISDTSAKWEVKSQIWDVTFALPPPPPASSLTAHPPLPHPIRPLALFPRLRLIAHRTLAKWICTQGGGGWVGWVRAWGTGACRGSDKGVKIEQGDKAERLARQWRQGVTSRGFNLSRLAPLC